MMKDFEVPISHVSLVIDNPNDISDLSREQLMKYGWLLIHRITIFKTPTETGEFVKDCIKLALDDLEKVLSITGK